MFKWRPKSFSQGTPFWELERMKNNMENIYNAFSNGVNQVRRSYTGVFPLINIADDNDNVYVTAEIPGIASEDIDISIKGDTLTLKGEIKNKLDDKEVNYHRKEREEGKFRRSLTLPIKVENEQAQAKFNNGILTITLPKAAEVKPHQINVTTI